MILIRILAFAGSARRDSLLQARSRVLRTGENDDG
jgi:hypothetical protein